MSAPTRRRLTRQSLFGAGLSVLVLAGGSTVALAAGSGAFGQRGSDVAAGPRVSSCAAPALPGSVIDVRLADMGAMMGSSRMMDGGGMMGSGGARSYTAAMMRLTAFPSTVPHGQVSFRVTSVGVRTHELVVLPLAAGQQPGQRSVGPDGTVEESGSLGEASASCAAGTGEGIRSGATGWVTLTLPSGRYELLCNLPGHYAGGMYAEVDIT